MTTYGAGLRAQSEMLIRRPDGQFPALSTRTHLSDPTARVAAAGPSSGAAAGSSSGGGGSNLLGGPLGSARLFYDNPAFVSSAQTSPARDGGDATESRLLADPAGKGKAPLEGFASFPGGTVPCLNCFLRKVVPSWHDGSLEKCHKLLRLAGKPSCC